MSAGKKSLLIRFVALILQGIASLMLYDEKYFNLAAALQAQDFRDDAAFKKAYFEIDYDFSWLIASAIVCNMLEVLTMSLGHPSTSSSFNLFTAVLHFIGFVMTVYMLVQPWRIQIYSYIFILCSAVPLALSSLFVVDLVVLKSSILQRIDVRI